MNDIDARMLQERAKELECLYAVDEVLQNKKLTLPAAMMELVSTIPIGFTDPANCRCRITLNGTSYAAPDFGAAALLHKTPISVQNEAIGEIAVGYVPGGESFPLLSNEVKLLDSISARISQLALSAQRELSLLFDMLQRIDPDMLQRIGEKLRVYLKNTESAEKTGQTGFEPHTYGEVNTPLQKIPVAELSKKLIAEAASSLPQGDLMGLISGWIQELRVFALVKAVGAKGARISGILEAVRKYTEATSGAEGAGEKQTQTWLVAALAHRFLTNDETLINLVLDNLSISDFAPMIEKIIAPDASQGNIGGKGAGLFIAKQILDHAAAEDPILAGIKTPRTWYLATDQIVDFLHYNNLEDLNSYKYNSAFHLRMTYDGVVAKIKNAKLPPHTMNMLRIALDDLGDVPIIVRSSSLLEDRQSGTFSGKYKSLFLANTGGKEERLEALADAVLEVYSSMYNPDSIEYRRERGLLNFTEEMGVLIQQVVGQRVGDYFLPAFAGVAFSRNLMRWSPRIAREDGLVRMVMGLGTRAVDRVNDDYPVLFAPGQPELRVNQTPAEIRHYSPKHIDLIDLEKGGFETKDVAPFLKEAGADFPNLFQYVSVYNTDYIETKNAFSLNPKTDDMVVTFDYILSKTDTAKKLKRMLDVLRDKMGAPVDIEFAFDGESLFLLQCRPQGYGAQNRPAPIPKNLPEKDMLFTANRFISDGLVEGVTHIVYVDGDAYNALPTREDLLAVGTAVGLLNDALPRRRYILMGPGRWGSRGDIKLGVRVTYSDISGTAALIEIAKEQHSYVPELSFGTHFFQDLVESGIVYIPLYPDQTDATFREHFFTGSENLLSSILPQYARLSDVVHVIDVPAVSQGRTLSIHMNADLEQAVAFLKAPSPGNGKKADAAEAVWKTEDAAEHWQWRSYMARQIADSLPMEEFGVKGVYLFGSTNTGAVGMGSDIDMMFLVDGTDAQRRQLENWLDGWSRALAKINFLHTGYNTELLLDAHIVTESDVANGNSFALKIDSSTDPATLLRRRD